MKDTKKYKESRQLHKGGCLYKDRVEPESSAGAPSISSMSENKENNVNEYNGRLLEKILEPANLNLAYKKVRANRGSSGVDGMTVEDLLSVPKTKRPNDKAVNTGRHLQAKSGKKGRNTQTGRWK